MEDLQGEIQTSEQEFDRRGEIPLALFNRWRNHALRNRNWLASYRLLLFCLGYLLLLSGWLLLGGRGVKWNPNDPAVKIALGILMFLFLILRIQVTAIPGLLFCEDMKENLWDLFRIVNINNTEISFGLFLYAFLHSALPLGLACLWESMLIWYIVNPNPSDVHYLAVQILITTCFYITHALFFIVLGYIGAAISRRAAGVICIIIVPIAISIWAGGPNFALNYFGNFAGSIGKILMPGGYAILPMPENLTAFNRTTYVLTSLPVNAQTLPDLATILYACFTFLVLTIILWSALQSIIEIRLAKG